MMRRQALLPPFSETKVLIVLFKFSSEHANRLNNRAIKMPISRASNNSSETITEWRYKSVSLALQESQSFITNIQYSGKPVRPFQLFLVHVRDFVVVVAIALDDFIQTTLTCKPNSIDLVSDKR